MAGGIVGAGLEALGAEAKRDKIPIVTLGRTGLKVSRIALGTTQAPDRNILAYCISQGLNFIDTAPNYAHFQAEAILGRRFRELNLKRESLVIASKNKSRDPSSWPRLVRESCKRLGIEYLDIFYAHSLGGIGKHVPDSPTWPLRPEVERGVRELKRSGLIRFFGYTSHAGDKDFVNALIRNAAKADYIDVMMVRYNFRDYGDERLAESLAIAHKAGQGVIAMKTQSGAKATPEKVKPFLGDGFNHWQAAIRWAASNPNVHVVCANMRNLEMAKQNIEAIKRPRLSASELDRLMIYAQATSAEACRMCASCAKACPEGIALPEILRAVMYCEDYGDPDMARQIYAEIEPPFRPDRCRNCGACEAACPNGLAIREKVAFAANSLSWET